MPYELYKQGKKYCVRNQVTKESKGCSISKKRALGHLAALYAAENDSNNK